MAKFLSNSRRFTHFDAFGNLVGRTEADGGTVVSDVRYAVDGWDTTLPSPTGNENYNIYAVLTSNGAGGWTPASWTVFGSSFDQPLASISAAGAVQWYVADRQGSVVGVFDNAGNALGTATYDAYGNITSGDVSGVSLYGFQGGEYDPATGYVNYGGGAGRWYAPAIQQWTKQDPLGFGGGQSNLSEFVGNDPMNGTDPSGRWWYSHTSNGQDPVDKMMDVLADKGIKSYRLNSNEPVLFGLPKYHILYVPEAERGKLKAWLKSQSYEAGGKPVDASGHADLMYGDQGARNLQLNNNLGFTFGNLDGITEQNRNYIKAQIERVEKADQAGRQARIEPAPWYKPPISDKPLINPAQVLLEPLINTAAGVLDSAFVLLDDKYVPHLNKHLADAAAGRITMEEAEKQILGDIVDTATLGSGAALRVIRTAKGGVAAVVRVNRASAAKATELFKSETMTAEQLAAKTGVKAEQIAADFGSCFAAGTPLLTPDGSKRIEEFKPGDFILSRDEHDSLGPVEVKAVEAVFVRAGQIWEVRVNGRVIRTTGEHPFFAWERGWVQANELRRGDTLLSLDQGWVSVEEVVNTERWETVYNLRVAEYHTYFVGCDEWGFSVWAHNTGGDCQKFLNEMVAKGRLTQSEADILRNSDDFVRIFNSVENPEAVIASWVEKRAKLGKLYGMPTDSKSFAKWFNSVDQSELDRLYRIPEARDLIKEMLRHGGGDHEWLMVARGNKFREWGKTYEDITKLTTPTKDTWFLDAAGKKHAHTGTAVSNKAHQEILQLIDSSSSFEEFAGKLRTWASTNLPNGVADLPAGLR